MAWNKTQAVILYAVIIWALYNGGGPTGSGFWGEGRGFTGSGAIGKSGGGSVEIAQIKAGQGTFAHLQTGAGGTGMPSY